MLFKVKPVVHGLALAFGGLAVVGTAAYAQQTPAQQQQLERITITGSNIRRTDQETVAPVEIITREQIERTGRPTVADVLKTIPANIGGSFGESFSNSFAAGAAGISLRGLGQKSTLVLLNGRRVTGYGFAQNIQETFVDLNAIPASAVDRIEILKDGASAIYGSDAIAGVVNIILRRDFKGIEVAGDVGFFEGAQDYRANVIAGFGDLGSDRNSTSSACWTTTSATRSCTPTPNSARRVIFETRTAVAATSRALPLAVPGKTSPASQRPARRSSAICGEPSASAAPSAAGRLATTRLLHSA